jgi:DNA-binding CsgD family transcriptional regulator
VGVSASLVGELEALGRAALAVPEYVLRARTIIARRVAFADCCFAVIDPVSALPRWVLNEVPAPSALVPRWLAIEMSEAKHLNLAEMPWGPRHNTYLLSADTAGVLERSTRYTEILRPLDLKYELRVIFRARGITWGGMALIRSDSEPDFDPEEVELVRQTTRLIAEGLRRTILTAPTEGPILDDSPAVLVLSADNRVVSCTQAAGTLLDELKDMGAPDPERLPMVVRAVAQRARGRSDSTSSVSARTQARGGAWLTIRGATLDGGLSVAVVIERSRPAEIAPLMLAAYGLSPRECDVAKHVLLGLSTEDISETLSISVYTVQDHLKAIFDQTGVSSRKELAARLFLRAP